MKTTRIHNSQMDVWPDDIFMTTIHTEAILAWAHHSRKPYGMGKYPITRESHQATLQALAEREG